TPRRSSSLRSTPRACDPTSPSHPGCCSRICPSWSRTSDDPQLWKRNDEAATAAAKLGLLIDHLVRHVPGEHEDLVRLLLEQGLGRPDLESGSGQPPALLAGIAVDDEVEHVRPEVERVEQHHALRRRAVGRDPLAVPLAGVEKVTQLVP